MSTKYRVGAILDLHNDIESVVSGSRQHNRYALADVYQVALAAEGFFPKKPLGLLSTTPANLRRKVDKSCSMCIRPEVMKRKIETAKQTLTEYKASLVVWLQANSDILDDGGELIDTDLQDLDSNLDKI